MYGSEYISEIFNGTDLKVGGGNDVQEGPHCYVEHV